MGLSMEAKADRIANYVRIRRKKKKDAELIHTTLQKGLGIQHPEKINGYAGFFFDLGDVYASGYVADRMNNKRFRDFVMDCLKRFDKGEYGEISRQDEDENGWNRWQFGIGRLFGRYGYDFTDREKGDTGPYFEVICIRMHENNTWVTFDSEADWFLFLEDDQLELLPDRSWPEDDDRDYFDFFAGREKKEADK